MLAPQRSPTHSDMPSGAGKTALVAPHSLPSGSGAQTPSKTRKGLGAVIWATPTDGTTAVRPMAIRTRKARRTGIQGAHAFSRWLGT